MLGISIGLVYLWFGLPKFFSGVSPAEELAIKTIHSLTLGVLPDRPAYLLLALWETVVGLGLIMGLRYRIIFQLAILHMICTFTPLFLFPELTFGGNAPVPTLTGQYILKNLIILSALVILQKQVVTTRKPPGVAREFPGGQNPRPAEMETNQI